VHIGQATALCTWWCRRNRPGASVPECGDLAVRDRITCCTRSLWPARSPAARREHGATGTPPAASCLGLAEGQVIMSPSTGSACAKPMAVYGIRGPVRSARQGAPLDIAAMLSWMFTVGAGLYCWSGAAARGPVKARPHPNRPA